MTYYDNHTPSVGSKTALLLFTLIGLLSAYVLLISDITSKTNCTLLLLVSATIFYLRLAVCILFFVKRKISWVEGCSVGMLYGILLYLFSLWGSHIRSVSFITIIGITFFIMGSWINSQADYQRYKWKKKPENWGHLYTDGWFRYAIHINFFGDTIMFLGYALITQSGISFIPVICIILNFILIQIPTLDDYLNQRYGSEFIEYAFKTKKFIPFIY
jgi:protein-S-isoprenylcysteine O-methyltransferase Ste14